MNGTELQPAFVTADECRRWLAEAPLGNPVQALAQFLRQLNLLNRHDIEASARLGILEQLRKPLLAVQDEGTRRFAGKPLPLAPPEQAAHDTAQAVWHALMTGYRRCLEAKLAEGGTVKAEAALAGQRALATLAASGFDSCRAGFEPDGDYWRSANALYAMVEDADLAGQPVEDAARQGKIPSSAQAAFAEIMLLHAAGPNELPLRQLTWVGRWAQRWSAKVVIQRQEVPAGPAVPLCANLAGAGPAGYRAGGGPGIRWLDTAGIRLSLKRRLALLEGGTAPAELQLGSDCLQPACGQLLRHVYQRWCKGGAGRSHERQLAEGHCEVVSGIEAIHYYLSGRQPFRQPGYADDDTLRREREKIATFGRMPLYRNDGYSELHGFRIEQWQALAEWQLVDESFTGVHASHALAEGFARVSQGQLLAVRPPAAQALVLGWLRWLMVGGDGRLHAGILLIPGRPQPVAMRPLDEGGPRNAYRPGFLLPAVGALGSSQSVVAPLGCFRHGRIIEIATMPARRIRLLRLEERGADFDRASYEPA